MNPILEMLSKNRQSAGISSLIERIKCASDPQSLINDLAQSDPQVQQTMNLVRQYGDAKTAFYAIAKERGINPDEILGQLR